MSPPSPSAPVSDLRDHLGFWLRLVSNHVSQSFAARLAGQDVTVAEWVLMRTLHARAPTPPSRLAQDLGMTRGAITKLADRLVAKALLVREASETDKRGQTLALTAQGAAVVPELAALADWNDGEIFAALTAEDRATLLRLLRTLAERGQMTAVPVE